MRLGHHFIVTEEFSGINRSGGIGACSCGLAQMLARLGCGVDVLVTDLTHQAADAPPPTGALRHVRFHFLSQIVKEDEAVSAPTDEISKAYAVYRYLKARAADVVHFNDWRGSGFYCGMARRQGLFAPLVVSHLHGSSEWVRRHNLQFVEIENYECEAIERSQIENSDFIVSPSAYLLDYYRSSGLKLPEARTINWLLPQWLESPDRLATETLATRSIAPRSIDELIFFGRHERRKGFALFVEAVRRLPSTIQPDLTFIGRFDRVGLEFSGSFVMRKLGNYGGRIRFLDNLDQRRALSAIARKTTALCVMPSLIENSPCVIGECFTVGAPFLTTNVGGIAELIDPTSRAYCLTSPTPDDLSRAIERCVETGMPAIASALTPSAIADTWTQWVRSLPAPGEEAIEPLQDEAPLVSVCVTHYERPELLGVAIAALMQQTYSNVEIIVVDDGSDRTEAHAYLDRLELDSHRFPIKVIRSENRYLGAARNLAASHADGEFLLFHDDDNFAEPNEIELFVSAAKHSGYDILTSQYWIIRTGDGLDADPPRKIEYYPIGIGGMFSFFRNRFGDANALFRRRIFNELGGFTELHGVGWEDWELFLRAYIRGVKIGVVPEPLFNYRISAQGMLATGDVARNHERMLAMIETEHPRLTSDLLRYSQRQSVQQQIKDKLSRELMSAPSSRLHQELAFLQPGSPEARTKLVELAFGIGRTADAIELGLADSRQRQTFLALVSKVPDFAAQLLPTSNFISFDPNGGKPVTALRGWAFTENGRPFLPKRLTIDGRRYGIIGHVTEGRPDVAASFNLPHEELLGFTLLAVQDSRHANFLSRWRRRELTTALEHSFALGEPTPASLRAHIDEISRLQLVKISLPGAGSVHNLIFTSAGRDSIFLKSAVGFVRGTPISDVEVSFSNTDSRFKNTLTAIVPTGGTIWLQIE